MNSLPKSVAKFGPPQQHEKHTSFKVFDKGYPEKINFESKQSDQWEG